MNKTHTLEELKLALAKQPEAAPAPDYGEPWIKEVYNTELGDTGDYEGHLEILDRNNGKRIAECCNPDDENEANFDRIIACVNSMAGIPDPAAFVAQAKEMREAIEEAYYAILWCCEKEPSPCRCLDFATPPHVCTAHRAASKLKPFLP